MARRRDNPPLRVPQRGRGEQLLDGRALAVEAPAREPAPVHGHRHRQSDVHHHQQRAARRQRGQFPFDRQERQAGAHRVSPAFKGLTRALEREKWTNRLTLL